VLEQNSYLRCNFLKKNSTINGFKVFKNKVSTFVYHIDFFLTHSSRAKGMKLKQTLRSQQNVMNKKIFQMIKLVGIYNFFGMTC